MGQRWQVEHEQTHGFLAERLLDSVSAPIMYLDTDLIFRYVNRSAAIVLGSESDRVADRKLADFVGVDSELYAAVSTVAKTQGICARIIRYSPPDTAAEHHLAVTCSPALDETGGLTGVYVEGFDVTEHMSALLAAQRALETEIAEHKQTESDLRESTLLFSITFEHAAVGIVLADMSGRVVQANPKFDEMLGYERRATIGLPINDFATLEDTLDDTVLLKELLGGRTNSYEIEKHYVREDESVFVGSMTVSVVRDDSGTALMTIGVLEDVTEKRRAEQLHRELDLKIRAAYSDVIDAATGGRLILLTLEELRGVLGELLDVADRIGEAQDLGAARHRIRERLEALEHPPRDIDGLVLAASEAITNAIKHAGGGQYAVRERDGVAQVVVADWGMGIDFGTLPKATLVAGFSTAQSLGMGYTIMLDVCDRILLATEPGTTTVVLEMNCEATRELPGLDLPHDKPFNVLSPPESAPHDAHYLNRFLAEEVNGTTGTSESNDDDAFTERGPSVSDDHMDDS